MNSRSFHSAQMPISSNESSTSASTSCASTKSKGSVNRRKYSIDDAVNFVSISSLLFVRLNILLLTSLCTIKYKGIAWIDSSWSPPGSKFPCSQQYLHSLVSRSSAAPLARIMSNTVITIDEADDITDLSSATNPPPDPPRPKRKWMSSKEKNMQRVRSKKDAAEQKAHRDVALAKAVALLDYADTIAWKVARNKKYIEQEEMRNHDFCDRKRCVMH